MSKRALSALLWYGATWVGYEIVWSLTGAPRVVGPILAFAVAALVTIDPLAVFWPRSHSDVASPAIRPGIDRKVVAPR